MRLGGTRQSINVEDRRFGGRNLAVGGGLGTLLIVILAVLFGADPAALLQQVGLPEEAYVGQGPSMPGDLGAGEGLQDPQAQFVRKVLAETEDAWDAVFRQMGHDYVAPRLVLFRGQAHSACGFADAAVGPFYCPGDSKVYLDLGFFEELERRFKAPGDFAQAYVIAHEIGHHVQNLLGISDQVHALRRKLPEKESNALSMRLELQADFFAGVWAYHANKERAILEEGDVEEGLRAASAIGDDNIQRRSTGYVVPDSFTHGTSQQRVRWFKKGLQTGDLSQGDSLAEIEP